MLYYKLQGEKIIMISEYILLIGLTSFFVCIFWNYCYSEIKSSTKWIKSDETQKIEKIIKTLYLTWIIFLIFSTILIISSVSIIRKYGHLPEW